MIKIGFIICTLFGLTAAATPASAASLDELYRDIVRSDNSGYLPLYVKNRNAPEFLFDDRKLKNVQETKPPLPVKENDLMIDFENHRQKREIEEMAKKQRWQQALEAVKAGKVTPVDLSEIENKVAENNPVAIEVYAYMYAKGIGVKPDLIKSFTLYQQAEKLGVKNALQNAAEVYKAMNFEQRAKLSPFREKD